MLVSASASMLAVVAVGNTVFDANASRACPLLIECGGLFGDTLKASKMLVTWRDQGLLMPLPDRAKWNVAYAKAEAETPDLLSTGQDNKSEDS